MAIIRTIDDGTGGLAEVSLHDDYCKLRVGSDFNDIYYNGVVLLDEELIDELIQILQEFKKENFTNG